MELTGCKKIEEARGGANLRTNENLNKLETNEAPETQAGLENREKMQDWHGETDKREGEMIDLITRGVEQMKTKVHTEKRVWKGQRQEVESPSKTHEDEPTK